MIINHERRFIFVSNPKTGTRSIETLLAEFQDEPELHAEERPGFYTKATGSTASI